MSTAPASAAPPVDYRRLQRVRWMEEADPARKAYIVSFPKSGRTWLRVVLSRYKQHLLGLEAFDLKLHLVYAERPQPQRQFIFTHAGSNWPWNRADHRRFWLARLFNPAYDSTRHFTLERCLGAKVVLLVRDPRDTVVSYYHHRARRMPNNRYRGGPGAFLRDPHLGLPKIVAFLNFLAGQRARFAHHLLFYEDMHSDLMGEMERLLAFCGLPLDPAALEESLAYASFDNMRALERASRYGEELSSPDAADPAAAKVRQGRVGSYRDELGPDDAAWADAYVREHLHPLFGRYTHGR